MTDEWKPTANVALPWWRVVMLILVGGGLFLELVPKYFFLGLLLQIVGLGISLFQRRQ